LTLDVPETSLPSFPTPERRASKARLPDEDDDPAARDETGDAAAAAAETETEGAAEDEEGEEADGLID